MHAKCSIQSIHFATFQTRAVFLLLILLQLGPLDLGDNLFVQTVFVHTVHPHPVKPFGRRRLFLFPPDLEFPLLDPLLATTHLVRAFVCFSALLGKIGEGGDTAMSKFKLPCCSSSSSCRLTCAPPGEGQRGSSCRTLSRSS